MQYLSQDFSPSSTSCESIRAAAQAVMDEAYSKIAILEQQELALETAYQHMILAADGFRNYALAVRGEIARASYNLNRYQRIATKDKFPPPPLHYTEFVLLYYNTSKPFCSTSRRCVDMVVKALPIRALEAREICSHKATVSICELNCVSFPTRVIFYSCVLQYRYSCFLFPNFYLIDIFNFPTVL